MYFVLSVFIILWIALFLEKFTPLAKILHCRWQWQHWQISPLFKAPIAKPHDYHIFNWRAKPCWKHEFQTGFSNTFKYKPKCVLIIIDIASYHIWPHLIIIDITSDNVILRRLPDTVFNQSDLINLQKVYLQVFYL